MKCNAISQKIKKEGKPHGKNPPPKREMKKQDARMDGVNKTPITTHIMYILLEMIEKIID